LPAEPAGQTLAACLSCPRFPRLLVLAAVGLAALVLLLWIFSRLQPLWGQRGLRAAILRIEPWGSTTNYSAAGWQRLAHAARLLRATPPALADQVFARLGAGPDAPARQLQAFLLLRFAFDLPEQGALSDRGPSRPEIPAPGEANPDGSANLAWPIRWNGGRPELVAGSQGALEPGYSPQQDFTFLRYKYRYRELDTLQR
jgi:hypothetical protein